MDAAEHDVRPTVVTAIGESGLVAQRTAAAIRILFPILQSRASTARHGTLLRAQAR